MSGEWHWGEGTKFAAEAVKALFALNGASAVSILTFIGNTHADSNLLVCSLVCFAFGAFFAVPAFGTAYLTQLQYGNSEATAERGSGEAALYHSAAARWHKATYRLVALGAGLFMAGIISAASGLAHSVHCGLGS
jgi:hypothetical protein